MAQKVRNPWFVVLGSGMVNAVGPSPLIMTTLGVFIIPITESTGWPRTMVTAAFAGAALGMAIGFPLVGYLLGRFSMRLLAFIGLTSYAVSVVLIGALGNVLPLFFLFFALQGFFGATLGVPYSKAIVSWFDNRRGLAMGIMTGIAAVGTTLMPLWANLLISLLGWQLAYVSLGATAAIIGLPALLLFVRVRGEVTERGRLVDPVLADKRVDADLPGLTFKQALRTRHFWLIAVGLGATSLAVGGLQTNTVPILVEQGIDATTAAVLFSILGLAALIGRVVGGLILDRIHGAIIGAIFIFVPAIGMFMLTDQLWLTAAGVALIGLGIGIEGDLLSFFLTRYLGVRAFPQILGVVLSFFLIGNAIGPQILSISYDSFGSYLPVLPWLAGILAVAALMILFLGKYRYPAVDGFDKLAAEDEFAAEALLTESDAPVAAAASSLSRD